MAREGGVDELVCQGRRRGRPDGEPCRQEGSQGSEGELPPRPGICRLVGGSQRGTACRRRLDVPGGVRGPTGEVRHGLGPLAHPPPRCSLEGVSCPPRRLPPALHVGQEGGHGHEAGAFRVAAPRRPDVALRRDRRRAGAGVLVRPAGANGGRRRSPADAI